MNKNNKKKENYKHKKHKMIMIVNCRSSGGKIYIIKVEREKKIDKKYKVSFCANYGELSIIFKTVVNVMINQI